MNFSNIYIHFEEKIPFLWRKILENGTIISSMKIYMYFRRW